MQALRSLSVFDGERFLDGGATVLIEGDTILGVEPTAYDVPHGCEVVTHAGTLMPGLIDCHVHLVFDATLDGAEITGELTDAELDARIEQALGQQVAQGVTTVRDLGDVRYRALYHRDLAHPRAPRILAAGPPLTIAGGHCHFLGGVIGQDETSIDAAVRDRVDRGVDVIKVMASGGILTPESDQFGTQFDTDVLRVLGDLAHAKGVRVLAHSHSLIGIEASVAAGLDGIEHFTGLRPGGIELPPDLLDRMAQQAISACPTLGLDTEVLPPPARVPGFAKVFRQLGMPPETPDELMWEFFRDQRLRSIDHAYAHGVRLISGSDAGVAPPKPHGALFRSVLELAEVMPLNDALATATSLAAEDCGVPAGRLRPGLSADLLVLNGDVRDTPDSLGNPLAVMVRGQMLTQEPAESS